MATIGKANIKTVQQSTKDWVKNYLSRGFGITKNRVMSSLYPGIWRWKGAREEIEAIIDETYDRILDKI